MFQDVSRVVRVVVVVVVVFLKRKVSKIFEEVSRRF